MKIIPIVQNNNKLNNNLYNSKSNNITNSSMSVSACFVKNYQKTKKSIH